MKWISYMYPYIPSFLNFPPNPPISPLYIITEHQAEFPVLDSSFSLAILQCLYVNPMLPVCLTHPLPSSLPHVCLYVCVSLSALQTGSSVPSF